MKSQSIWVASDLLFGMRRLVDGTHEWIKREAGYEWRWLKAARQVIGDDDCLVLLGNVCVGRYKFWYDQFKTVPGRKLLLLGDRDPDRPWWWYKRFGFNKAVPQGESLSFPATGNIASAGPVLFSHMPAFPGVLTQQDDIKHKRHCQAVGKQYDRTSSVVNIHGHTLGRGMEDHRTIDAGIDLVGEYPIKLEQLLDAKFRA